MERPHVAATFHKGNDRSFIRLHVLPSAFSPANVGFVHFHSAAHHGQSKVRRRVANTVRHEPRALVGYAKHPVKLVSTHSFFGRAEQMNRHEPLVKWDVAVLKNRAYGYGELLAARTTLPNSLTNGTLGTFFRL
jgi:hypothetical protein